MRLLIGDYLLKNILFLFIFMLSFSVTIPCLAMTTLNVAVLPAVNTADYKYQDDIKIIEDTIRKPFKYPYYSLLPLDRVQLTTQFPTAGNHIKLTDSDTMAQIANRLSADLVIAVELKRARMDRVHSVWLDDTYVDSDVIIKCYAYSTAARKYEVFKAVKYNREPESINTNADTVFKELTEELLTKLPYKRIPIEDQKAR